VEVSSPDRLVFPEVGLTKADLVGHYQRVGERMLEVVAGRPLTLERFPAGVDEPGFMQKNVADHFPASIGRFEVSRQEGGSTTYPVVDRAEDLAWLANQGTVAFHVWTSTASRPDHPDWLVLDLDPAADDLAGARSATRVAGGLCERFGLEGTPVATGSSGFHVWVPLDGASTTKQVALASRALAGLAAAEHPDALTIEVRKAKRSGRVFVDWLRNTASATVVAPFSLRPRPSAPVAVPLRWEELADATPDGWTLTSLGERLDVPLLSPGQALPLEPILEAAHRANIDTQGW